MRKYRSRSRRRTVADASIKINARYFIAKFEAIPEDEWCTGVYRQAGQCDALGHCYAGVRCWTSGADALTSIFEAAANVGAIPNSVVIACNDGDGQWVDYESSPKRRMIKALSAARGVGL